MLLNRSFAFFQKAVRSVVDDTLVFVIKSCVTNLYRKGKDYGGRAAEESSQLRRSADAHHPSVAWTLQELGYLCP